jgi:two-component system, cell cycle sensor histidine kinase and response regulator CckA
MTENSHSNANPTPDSPDPVASQLARCQSLLQAIQKLAGIGSWEYDFTSKIQTWSDQACAILGVPNGYVPELVLGLELFDYSAHEAVQNAVERAIEQGGGFDLDLLRLTADGEVLWIRTTGRAEFVDDQLVRLSGMFQDVTGQRRSQNALKLSHERLRQITDCLPDPVFQLQRSADGNYSVTFMSAALHRVLALDQDSTQSAIDRLRTLFTVEQFASLRAQADHCAEQNMLWETQFTLKFDQQAERTFALRARPEKFLDGRVLFNGFASDISDRKLQAEQLKAAEQLQNNHARLESIGQMAGGIAHDFNNALTSIVMSLSLLEMSVSADEDATSLIREALSATAGAQSLTRQLLTFSKGAQPIKALVDSALLVRESVSFALRGSAVDSRFALASELWPVLVDAGQIQQVIHNIVLNAAQAMNGRGTIEIRASNVSAQARLPDGLPPRNYLRVDIHDTGPGIPKDFQSRLFAPFATTKQNGSGLGLASAFSIVRRHAGIIVCESELGQGCLFSIWLPAESEASVIANNTLQGLRRGHGRILVMDDNASILQMLSRALLHLGYQATMATNGEMAAELFASAKAGGQPFRAVLVDQTVPGGSGGVAALNALRLHDPDVRAIVTSGYADGDVLARFRDYGFVGVLKKPFRLQELASALDAVLASPSSRN